ncbi:50S ribosomal protein L11 methyltransferase [Pseudalkalibacillus caeni]|uniref:50S ribosomal protein L11 methyltransferase n=1 Tax=Exobacillus caeni TaxID=2574798 RepID=A0A5R9F5J0_9BACL|nr:50S ribosomal protein L11 methyltransferase [Pseudalkalibacillus caeni]TLS37596.1 50S ribosomal protein L11 methyltransferase [Pseudalkalibacillus caeni]
MYIQYQMKVPYRIVEQTIEKLNGVGLVFTHYDVPIEVEKDQNGYRYEEVGDANVNLEVYVEDTDEKPPEHYMLLISKTVGISQSEITYREIKDENWQKPFEDVMLTNGWVICTPESEANYVEHKIVLDPQGAFGTGLHETTQNCLQIMLEKDFSGLHAVDLGAGSGILSVAAAIRNAQSVESVDIQPVEREINYNALLNQISNITVNQADLLSGEYRSKHNPDFIIINIGVEETIKIIQVNHLFETDCSEFLVSGIVEWNEKKITDFFVEAGYPVKERIHTNEWVTVLFSKS